MYVCMPQTLTSFTRSNAHGVLGIENTVYNRALLVNASRLSGFGARIELYVIWRSAFLIFIKEF